MSVIKNISPVFANAYLSPKEQKYAYSITLNDLEAIRLVISGDSVIDWKRMHFQDLEEIRWFIRVNGFDPDEIQDRKRLERLIRQAIQYLDETYPHRLPLELRNPYPDIYDLFQWASAPLRGHVYRHYACQILKVMHTINHMDARELLHRCHIPPNDLYQAVNDKVMRTIKTMQEEDFHIVDFYGGRKDKSSIITKLLSKKENHAAAIMDRVRFRIVTLYEWDILPVLYYLGRTLCPFNYVIPNSSHNNLIAFHDLLMYFPHLRHYAHFVRNQMQKNPAPLHIPDNTFSSPHYKALNIVCDVPVRVDNWMYSPHFSEYGRIVFVTVEFQIMDQRHYQSNEEGDGNHQKYKQRQLDAVRRRLGIDE